MNDVKPRPLLADCPYCGGTGTDAGTWDHRCGRCNGRGRMARFMVEEILAHRAEHGLPGEHGLDAGTGTSSEAEPDPADHPGGGRDDDPNPPRPYRWRPAA
ncbi:MAG TPA: hypothetical protein VGX23_38030 [Actinocrinis sp.]|nr:hypothetical protein [Actinocrinis sp.]